MSDDIEDLRHEVSRLAQRVAELEGRSRFDHLEVERIDVLDADGTLRLSAAGADRSADSVIGGQVVAPGRARPGLLFFNGAGDECGGLIFDGATTEGGGRRAGASLTFDRFAQDQVVALQYVEGDEGWGGGLRVIDRPEVPLTETVAAVESGADHDHPALAAPARAFVGRTAAGDAVMELCDGAGRGRLRLSVSASGEVAADVIDDDGRTTSLLRSR